MTPTRGKDLEVKILHSGRLIEFITNYIEIVPAKQFQKQTRCLFANDKVHGFSGK